MRRYFFLILLVFSSCEKPPSKETNWFYQEGKLKVLTTIAMIEDIVKQVGGEHIETLSLIKKELDPHSYELVKGDDEKFQAADLIFYNGLGLEHGLSLRRNLEKNPKAVSVAEPILQEDPSLILIVEGQYDPHVWMDIALWMRIIDPIEKALSEKDPIHAKSFEENAKKLKEKMREADQKAFERLQSIDPQKRFLVTSHDAFNYFTRHYLSISGEMDWKKRCEAPEGLAPEAQMSINDIINVISHIEKYQISVLFPESNVSKDSLKKIVMALKEKGREIHLCEETLYGDSMGDVKGYLEMMAHNIEVISKGLEK